MPKQNQPTAGGFKPYPEYKPTSVFWQTEAPKHWQVRKLKHTLRKLVREKHDGAELLVCTNKGTVVKRGDSRLGLVAEDESIYQGVSAGDLLIHGMDTWHGAMAVSHYDGMCTTVVHVCDCLADNSKSFVAYYLRNLANSRLFKLISNGVRQNTSDFRCWDKLAALSIVLPSSDEQRRIVAYLDEKTAKIDRLIQLKEREIELLNEKKQAMISKVVTRGLNPKVELVDSGVDWIGQVPKGWSKDKLFRIFSIIGSGTTPSSGNQEYFSDGDIPWVNSGDVYGKGVYFDAAEKCITKQAVTDYPVLRMYESNTLVIAMYGGSIGNMSIARFSFCCNQACCCLSILRDDFLMGYVFAVLSSAKTYWLKESSGGGQPNISQEKIRQTWIPVPPLPEQREIVAYLDGATAKIDAAVAAIEKGIGLLKERRTRLVSDAVTGRIDLRKEVA